MIAAILAVCTGFGIGKDNSLPWHYPEDLAYFKRTTSGHVVVMGNNTWKSLPEKVRPMPNRINVVIATQYDKELHKGADIVITEDYIVHYDSFIEDAILTPNISDTIHSAIMMMAEAFQSEFISDDDEPKDVFIIGGATIYEQLMPIVDEMHLTTINKEFDCDAFYNPFENNSFELSRAELLCKPGETNCTGLTVGIYNNTGGQDGADIVFK